VCIGAEETIAGEMGIFLGGILSISKKVKLEITETIICVTYF
jgi:hypothetical protein